MLTTAPLDAKQVGWFAARQPAVIAFLEERLLQFNGDAFVVALKGCWRVCEAFAAKDGIQPPRVSRSLLERAQAAVEMEMLGTTMWGGTCAHRQPELCDWVREHCADPPTPLNNGERRKLAMLLLAVIYALDESTTGRAVP